MRGKSSGVLKVLDNFDGLSLTDGVVRLQHVQTFDEHPVLGLVTYHRFAIICESNYEIAGYISLRLGETIELLTVAGQVGYEIEPEFRGNGFAARGLKLLLIVAKASGFEEMWVTCSPENLASKRTCENAGGTLTEIVDVPETSPLYANGARKKCRFVFGLRD